MALPPRPTLRPGLWALPLVLALVFAGVVLGWLRAARLADSEEQRLEMIKDALSLESQMTARLEREQLLLQELAAALHAPDSAPGAVLEPPGALQSLAPRALAQRPELQLGLQRFWISLTWLDGANRLLAHVTRGDVQDQPSGRMTWASVVGTSAHLVTGLPGGGSLVARYSPAQVLRQDVPWWLARKYDVRFIDGFGSVMASTLDGPERNDLQTYRIAMAPLWRDTELELIARERLAPWYLSLAIVLVAGFVLLTALVTLLLRRQMQEVSRAEAAWRTEAAWRGAMEDSLTVGLRARDFDGRLVFVNRAMADMVGFEPNELVGLAPPMPYWPPDSLDEIMIRHRRNMAGQAPRDGYEAVWRHRSGRLITVMLFEAPLVDARGQHIGWMASVLDITERKRMEEREQHRSETTAHHARLTMLGEVASTLAHELNQPLTVIASYNTGVLNALKREPGTDAQIVQALQRVNDQAVNAGRIVHRIREFLTRREPQWELCDLNTVVRDGVGLLARDIQRRGVQYQLHLDATLPAVWADNVLLEQVLINLVRNACDASCDSADPDRPKPLVDIHTLLSDDGLCVGVQVNDNGPGLGGQDIDALCAPFFSTKPEGMGMGLAICRSILQAHHGQLLAGSKPGGGACFSFSVPTRAAFDKARGLAQGLTA